MSHSAEVTSIHFTCAICDYVFDAKVKRPLVLPCSHSFCQDCLQQMELAQDKLCPLCRKSWSNHCVADLPSCYQLIPAATKPVKLGVMEQVQITPSCPDICGEHFDDYICWCETCDVPVCKKCWKFDHKGCDILLLEEKCESLQEKYTKSVTSLKEAHQFKFPIHLADNKKHTLIVRDLIEKLKLLDKELLKNENCLESWKITAEGILSDENVSCAPTLRDVLEICRKTSAVGNLELCLSAKSTPLLLQLACSFQEFPENGSKFLSSLNKNLNTVQNETHSSDGQAAFKTDPVMQDGGVWVISDDASANAANELMLTSSLRPSRLKVTWTCKREQQFALLMNCNKQIEVDIRLDCFSNFEKTSEENHGLCSSLITTSARCSVTHFWGHFEASCLHSIPKTIQSVGLVLRDQCDLQTLTTFCGAVFTQTYSANEREQLMWRDWTELNLSMASTFLPEYWNLSSWCVYTAPRKQEYLTLSTALSHFGIRLRLFLNQLVPGDICWMRGILHSMAISFSDPVPLFLPGASIDLDILLGVLRDSGQRWEVHLPTNLPQLLPIEKVAERYKKYGHTVTYDLA